MLDQQKFPDSPITVLNSDTHSGDWTNVPVKWELVADGDRFHVFLIAQLGSPVNLAIRIDWRHKNRLEFEPYKVDKRDERIPLVQETRGFCRLCLISRILVLTHDYHLFAFNCRTVSYLILTEWCRFDKNEILGLFEKHDLRCGVGSLDDCLSVTEIEHYVKHVQSEQEQQQQTNVNK